ncbi:DUF3017 domain-containing protein [Cellulomonas sp. DKR-3]|uniref:DUF3017 domain-containing protein n=1 Tax=Cellulomonas fulva TaxID=2835530 RepID=A0ABS5TZ94_9CELL|nr:DUF3017 domain-containing protein [Cellulomonas fulva]MBT0994422.1 DUF3017 domain-containing protein [Cellulomonas fulva]
MVEKSVREPVGDDAVAQDDAPDGELDAAQQPLDPRAIARASLQASRNASLWWTATGVVLACAVALVVGTDAGAFTLAGVLAACAVVRGVRPSPGPVALSVRSKTIDVAVLGFLAALLAVLAALLPSVGV